MYRESFTWVNRNQFPRTQTKSPQQCSFPRDLKSRPPISKQDKPQRCEIQNKIRLAFHSTLTWNERTVRQHLPLITGWLGKVNCKDSVPNRASEKNPPPTRSPNKANPPKKDTYPTQEHVIEREENECVLLFSVQKGSLLPRHTTASRRHTGGRW